MAVIKAVSSKAGIGQAIDYVTKEEKTEEKLVSGLHCEAETAKEEMQATKELWEKTGGRTYKLWGESLLNSSPYYYKKVKKLIDKISGQGERE